MDPSPADRRPATGLSRPPARSVRRRDTSWRPPVTAAGSPAAQPLYDARRGVYYAKPVLRGWLHLLCFGASLVSGPLLLASRHGGARITAVVILSATLSAVSGCRGLLHP